VNLARQAAYLLLQVNGLALGRHCYSNAIGSELESGMLLAAASRITQGNRGSSSVDADSLTVKSPSVKKPGNSPSMAWDILRQQRHFFGYLKILLSRIAKIISC